MTERDWQRHFHYLGWVLLSIGLAVSWLSIFPSHFDPTPEGIALVNTRLLFLGESLVFLASIFFAKMFYQQSNLAAYFAEELYPEETLSTNKGLEKE